MQKKNIWKKMNHCLNWLKIKLQHSTGNMKDRGMILFFFFIVPGAGMPVIKYGWVMNENVEN